MALKTYYLDKFFEDRNDSLKSAEHIVPLVLQLVQPKSVVDVGCATGEFLSIFKKHGVKNILGIDGPWVNKYKLRIPKKCFLSTDLEKPFRLNRTFDLVLSLEVGEHLCERSARTFVNTLTNLGPLVLFSAAIPFQGGTHHVNEQWPTYWVNLFKDNEYVPFDCIRRKIWNNDDVSFCYAQNIIFFVKKDYLKSHIQLQKYLKQYNEPFLPLVHPKMFLFKAKRYDMIIRIIPYPIKWVIIKIKLDYLLISCMHL